MSNASKGPELNLPFSGIPIQGTSGGLQRGRVVNRQVIGKVLSFRKYPLDMVGVDCSCAVSLDINFGVSAAVADGDSLFIYRRSSLDRTVENEVVDYAFEEYMGSNLLLSQYQSTLLLGMKFGKCSLFVEGFESLGIVWASQREASDPPYLTNFSWCVRIVNTPIQPGGFR